MSFLDLDRFATTPLAREPFDHLVVPGFIPAATLPAIRASYPRIDKPGSFPVSELRFGDAFASLLKELEGPALRRAVEEKFAIDLSGRPTMVTVRGQCSAKDGGIHTDSKSKLITVLIYLNEPWDPSGGRLRLLRGRGNLDDFAVEVPPESGLLLAFRRSERSFHGHLPYVGPRRVLQLNWVANRAHVFWDLARHRISAWTKRAA